MIASILTAVLGAVPNAWSYVAAAYLLTFGSILGYAAWVIVRGRRIGRQLPAEDRSWTR